MAPIGSEELGRWFDAHQGVLLLYARQWLADPEAQDLVQDAFLRLWQQKTPPENVKAWLFKVVRNGARNALRSRRRRQDRECELAQSRPELFEPAPGDLVDARTAQAALAELDQTQREVVVLRIWGELTLQEIADLTGLAVSTVFDRYRQGLAEIRKKLGHQE